MRKFAVVLLALVLAFALAWEFVPFRYEIWDGGYDLTVNFRSDQGIRSITCKACRNLQEVERTEENFATAESYASAKADPFDGKPLILRLPLSGRTSPMGREIAFYQPRFLVAQVVLQDGREVSKIVDIDFRKSRELMVSLP